MIRLPLPLETTEKCLWNAWFCSKDDLKRAEVFQDRTSGRPVRVSKPLEIRLSDYLGHPFRQFNRLRCRLSKPHKMTGVTSRSEWAIVNWLDKLMTEQSDPIMQSSD